MRELNSCDVHFVRCIKPNDDKVPNKIVQDYTLKQIRYLGVLDSLKVRKQNYPNRKSYQFFYKKYGDMTKNPMYPSLLKQNADFKSLVVKMFKDYYPEMGPELVLFGKDRIFVRTEGQPIIDKKYNVVIEKKNKIVSRI